MNKPTSDRMNTRNALAELMKSIEEAEDRRWRSRGGLGGEVAYVSESEPRTQGVDRENESPFAQLSPVELQKERAALERRAEQLDRMEEVLRRMLRSVESREDEVRGYGRYILENTGEENLKRELLSREQALREAEEQLAERERRIAERERFVAKTEARLLEKAREWAGSARESRRADYF